MAVTTIASIVAAIMVVVVLVLLLRLCLKATARHPNSSAPVSNHDGNDHAKHFGTIPSASDKPYVPTIKVRTSILDPNPSAVTPSALATATQPQTSAPASKQNGKCPSKHCGTKKKAEISDLVSVPARPRPKPETWLIPYMGSFRMPSGNLAVAEHYVSRLAAVPLGAVATAMQPQSSVPTSKLQGGPRGTEASLPSHPSK